MILLVFFLIIGLIGFGVLQLPISKNYIADQVVRVFDNQFEGTLKIERVSGLMPLNLTVHNAEVYSPDDTTSAVLWMSSAQIRLNLWDLIQQKLTITGFNLSDPTILLTESEDQITLFNAFKRTDKDSPILKQAGTDPLFVEIYAPTLEFENGVVSVKDINMPDGIDLPSSFTIRDISGSVFVEFTEEQRFLDIGMITARFTGTEWDEITVNGQLFSDNNYLELNNFRLETANSFIAFNMQAAPVNFNRGSLDEQFKNAEYRFELTGSTLDLRSLHKHFTIIPDLDLVVETELLLQGTTDNMYLDRFITWSGQSAVQLTGEIENAGSEDFRFYSSLNNVVLHSNEAAILFGDYFDAEALQSLTELNVNGSLNGSKNNLDTDIILSSENGALELDATTTLSYPYQYEALVQLDSLDLSPFIPIGIEDGFLNGRIAISGTGLTPDDADIRLAADLDESRMNHIEITNGKIELSYSKERFSHVIVLENSESFLETSGNVTRFDEERIVSATGTFRNIDIQHLMQNPDLPRTELNFSFTTDFQGAEPDEMYGRLSFQTDASVIGFDTLRAHQFYMDLNSPANTERQLRLTSSFFDAELNGTITPTLLMDMYAHWEGFAIERISKEILFDDQMSQFTAASPFPVDENPSVSLRLNIEVKDLELLQYYFTPNPFINSKGVIQASITADTERFLITSSLYDESFSANEFSANALNVNLTSSLRYSEPLKRFSTIDLQLNAGSIQMRDIVFETPYLNASMRDDSLMVMAASDKLADDLRFNITSLIKLSEDDLSLLIDDFYLGNERYSWVAEGEPRLIYDKQETLQFDQVVFSNNTEYVEIDGFLSSNPTDSLQYSIRNFDLEKISDLIGGRVTFSGILNGEFTSRTLTGIPSIQGDILVSQSKLENRMVGDVKLNSVFSPETDRFETSISVYTDPDKYSEYYDSNNNIGQNLQLNGYFKAPDDVAGDTLFYFDADLKEIDLWIVRVIIPTILDDVEGVASGSGFIYSTADEINFNASFNIEDVEARPRFTNTEYRLNGNLEFDRYDGLYFDSIALTDPQNGTGILSGTIDLSNFEPINYFDLTLDLNNLHFMNNTYDPDVPFYASARGSGQVRLTGTNFNPFLRTSVPITLSNNTRISIPLQETAEFEQDRRFIQFVDNFDLSTIRRGITTGTPANGVNGNGTDSPAEDLTFAELFTLDLQFLADNPISTELIFDRVTNEVLTATGTGQMRMLLEDQNFTMFGRLDIQGGDYQFVSGDIITRRFQIQDGGNIAWEGDPANARLNVTASYRARPDFSILSSTGGSSFNPDARQRFPVDLILEIGGTLTEIENDFFFRIPTGIEGTLDPTLAAQVNNLNRDEELKLWQATSILLTGSFLPISDISDGGAPVTENLTRNVVVNPLLSSQVINPLLSNQINSLLRSDIAFDVDVNLTTFNEIDLGIALRLYNDRIILRRDGQITGEQSDIGDIGATYRINRTFSLTAFHRQDPTLSNTSANESRQSQEINGIGLEAQVQFNTWHEFKRRISDTFRKIFARRENAKEEETAETLARMPFN
jgi:hypothetical protein